MTNQLKALEILKILKKYYTGKFAIKINEAIEELEALEYKDKLAELEKVILDYYLAKGYEVGVSGWAFNVEIESNYKSKQLLIYFRESMYEHYSQVFIVEVETTKEMFDKAIEYFSTRQNEVIECNQTKS